MGRVKLHTTEGERKSGKAAPFHASVNKPVSEVSSLAAKTPAKGRVKKPPVKRKSVVTADTEETVVPVETKTRKSPKFKHSTHALRRIRKEQKSVEPIIPKVVIRRVIRDALVEMSTSESSYRITVAGVEELYRYIDHLATMIFSECNNEAIKAGRVTIMPEDLREVVRLHIDRNSFERAPREIPFENRKTDNAALKARHDASVTANRAWRAMSTEERKVNQAMELETEPVAPIEPSAVQLKRMALADADDDDDDEDYVAPVDPPVSEPESGSDTDTEA
jgi:histone H3/H4